MQDANWLFDGTIFYMRDEERIFNVIPTSSVALGMINPTRLTQSYYMDVERMRMFVEKICDNLDYNPELFWHRGVRYEHRVTDEREVTFLVKSYSKHDETHKVTFRNLPRKNYGFNAMLASFKNLKHSCTCGRGTETDIICSMPYEACGPWGITREEWEESQKTSKIYGELLCNHEVEALVKHRAYPMFDESKIVLLLPEIMDTVMQLQSFNKEQLGIALKQLRSKLGLSAVLRVFLENHREKQEKEMKKLQTQLYSMPPVHRY